MLLRSRARIVAFAGALALLALLWVPDAGVLLEYRRAAIAAEPWRLFTANVVHINARHAFLNAAAWYLIARLFAADLSASHQLFVLTLGGLCVGVGLWLLFPGIAWYRGLSGALHALFFAGSTVRLGRSLRHVSRNGWSFPAVLVSTGWIKVALERPLADATPYVAWLGATTVPQAHLIGAVCGTLIGLIPVALNTRERRLNRGDVT